MATRSQRTEAEAEALIESLDRHFAAGCPSLNGGQLRAHEATGSCPECRQRAAAEYRQETAPLALVREQR